MKLTIEQREERWHVLEDGESLANFATEDEAKADRESRYGHELRDVEIFRAGIWNGDKYTVRDLDDMIAAAPDVGFRAPIKLGHAENSGDRAFGWVENLRRHGDRLVADFKDIPEKVFEVIKDRGFDTVSAEIFWNLKRGGKTFRRALKAVALLGAEIPAVSDLKPLRDAIAFNTDAESHAYSLTKEDFDVADKDETELKKLQDENAKLKADLEALKGSDDSESVKKLQADLEARDKRIEAIENERREERIKAKVDACRLPAYRAFLKPLYEAVSRDTETYQYTVGDKTEDVLSEAVLDKFVAKMNADAEKLFEEFGEMGDLARDDIDRGDEPAGEKADRLAREHMQKHGEKDYSVALHAVLDADPELKAAYAAQ